MFSLDQLDVFYRVATHGSFTRAARELGVSQPAVTRRIENLETSLGVTLFERRPGQLLLTSAGELLLPFARTLHETAAQAAQALTDLKADPTGVVRLAAPSMLMARYISPFQERYPQIALRFRRGTYEEMVAGLLDGDTDIGVFPMPTDDPRLDAAPFPGIEREPLVGVANPEHRLAGVGSLSLDVLSREPLVVRGGLFLREMIEEWARERGGSLRIVAEAPSSDDVKQLVQAGVGLGILPWMGVEQDVKDGIFKAWTLGDGSLSLQLYVATARNRRRSLSVERFLRFLGEVEPRRIELPHSGR